MKHQTIKIDANVYVLWACIFFVIFMVVTVRGLSINTHQDITVTDTAGQHESRADPAISPVTLAVD